MPKSVIRSGQIGPGPRPLTTWVSFYDALNLLNSHTWPQTLAVMNLSQRLFPAIRTWVPAGNQITGSKSLSGYDLDALTINLNRKHFRASVANRIFNLLAGIGFNQ
jgi:hypothetical protein